MEDARFAHISSDPKFKRIPKNERKVKIDKRFQSMFDDKKFQVKFTTDKRGRPINQSTTEDLRRYYALSSEDEASGNEDEEEKEPGKFVKAPKPTNDDAKDLKIKTKSAKIISNDVKKKLKNLNVDYARGESTLYSDSSSDDDEDLDEDAEDDDEADLDHKWGELDNDADDVEEPTTRLAICNMDWDRIRAVDLFVLFGSFLPPAAQIKSVDIYPSEFGKQRMAEEEIKGPQELVGNPSDNPENEEDEETEEGSKYHMEKLRKYQLNRLKYYYAVAVFDTPQTANKIYTECDGMEYESSATKLDLRFIPEDMTFDDQPKESCDKAPEGNKYEPRFFTTKALQQAKVDLTWDETNPERQEMTEKLKSGKLDDVTENDLNNYLAGSSDEESLDDDNSGDEDDDAGGNPLDKYKALLQDIEEKENQKKNRDVEMEVTWGLGLKQDAEKLVKKKLQDAEEKTPFQQYLDKRKDKRKEKREKKKNQLDDNNEDNSDVPSDIDMNDPYFAEEFQKDDFKKSKTNKKQTNSKHNDDDDDDDNGELELLLMNEDDGQKHFNLKKLQDDENESKSKRKRKLKKGKNTETEDNFEVDVKDNRFSALFTSHHYNLDPTDPNFRKTKAMDRLIEEKLKRRDDTDAIDSKKPKLEKAGKKKNAELNLLVKSVKRKTQAYKTK